MFAWAAAALLVVALALRPDTESTVIEVRHSSGMVKTKRNASVHNHNEHNHQKDASASASSPASEEAFAPAVALESQPKATGHSNHSAEDWRLLNVPHVSLVQFWSDAVGLTSPNTVSKHYYALVIASACVGGALHSVAMALRKFYGAGHEQYYLEWRWWLGTGVDAVAGCLLWPAMPIVPVQVYVPIVIVMQLSSSYLLGLIVFRERCTLNHNLGLAFAVVGVIGISMSTSHQAAAFRIDEFFASWMSIHFTVANLLASSLLMGTYFFAHQSTFFALLSAVLEGLQYICSRTIAESLFNYKMLFFKHPAVLAAVSIKVCCILGILHFQQQGLEADLSRFAGIFLVSCTLFTCMYGAAFFGEEVPSSFMFAASAFFTLGGIWLLNYRDEGEQDVHQVSLPIKDVEAEAAETDA